MDGRPACRAARRRLPCEGRLDLVAETPDKRPPQDPTAGFGTGQGRAVAIALSDEAPGAAGPRVVAKGHGQVAEQILTIAFERGVKVRSDADLAEILAAVELDSEVPLQALAAVAEILSYVYRSSGGMAAQEEPA